MRSRGRPRSSRSRCDDPDQQADEERSRLEDATRRRGHFVVRERGSDDLGAQQFVPTRKLDGLAGERVCSIRGSLRCREPDANRHVAGVGDDGRLGGILQLLGVLVELVGDSLDRCRRLDVLGVLRADDADDVRVVDVRAGCDREQRVAVVLRRKRLDIESRPEEEQQRDDQHRPPAPTESVEELG